MGRPKRIRRTLTLNVSEPQPANPNETWTPGQRFAHGWQRFRIFSGAEADAIESMNGDAVQIAGFLAAQAAWYAHHNAVNVIALADVRPPSIPA